MKHPAKVAQQWECRNTDGRIVEKWRRKLMNGQVHQVVLIQRGIEIQT